MPEFLPLTSIRDLINSPVGVPRNDGLWYLVVKGAMPSSQFSVGLHADVYVPAVADGTISDIGKKLSVDLQDPHNADHAGEGYLTADGDKSSPLASARVTVPPGLTFNLPTSDDACYANC